MKMVKFAFPAKPFWRGGLWIKRLRPIPKSLLPDTVPVTVIAAGTTATIRAGIVVMMIVDIAAADPIRNNADSFFQKQSYF
jgi:hypothetical protein